ncbi:epimerase [Gordonia soli]|uniref:DUF1731 domain-containing protein n=1 Tax=Gordonia soli NBRC 108243 TaxID=1223545 RepID=M0QKN4_9ACTN|nr:DUF1731 domain-containing protein [Gordonia soli]GAC69200.1 hypothetical protein GS4_22_00320 [Gordonia soli NBRC 108243]
MGTDASSRTPPTRVVIAGGSGALGRRIADDLSARGIEVTILTRSVDPRSAYRQVEWDGRTSGPWTAVLDSDEPTALINLAGKLVDCRPTAANIDELRRSRVEPTLALVEASASTRRLLTHWIQASTTAIWSDAGETWCTEDTPVPPGLPQMTGVAQPWEQASTDARADHRIVLRTSIVLDADSPALQRLVMLTRFGLGGRVSHGRQWISWIHIDDWLRIVRAGLDLEPSVALPSGVVIAATDNPVRNVDLMATLRRHLHRPPAPPTPAPVLRLGAILLRTDSALGLTGRRARSRVLAEQGFEFRYPELDGALADLIG